MYYYSKEHKTVLRFNNQKLCRIFADFTQTVGSIYKQQKLISGVL